MYFPSHGPYMCGSRTFPTNCRYCQRSVFYFFCDHGSKVFFEELGPPWPEHHCGARASQSSTRTPPQPSGLVAWPSLQGVTFSVQNSGYGLLPGLLPGMTRLTEAAIRRVRDSHVRPRETMRIDPLGAKPEIMVGRVVAVRKVELADRLGLQAGSVIAKGVDKHFPGLRAVQITLLVDEIDIDPDAEDLLSYSFWCRMSSVAESVAPHDIIRVELEPVDLLRGCLQSLELVLNLMNEPQIVPQRPDGRTVGDPRPPTPTSQARRPAPYSGPAGGSERHPVFASERMPLADGPARSASLADPVQTLPQLDHGWNVGTSQ